MRWLIVAILIVAPVLIVASVIASNPAGNHAVMQFIAVCLANIAGQGV